ncbi:MAG: 3-dehydroquinate synthase II [Candidatus Hydrothermarchaeota archaeon]
MKEIWVDVRDLSWEEAKPIVTTSLESGINCFLSTHELVEKIADLGKARIAVFGEKLDDFKETDIIITDSEEILEELKVLGKETGYYAEIFDKKSERKAAKLGPKVDYLLVKNEDWTIIPLENLIAELQKVDTKIVACIKNADEARIAFKTLEVGVDGVLIKTPNLNEIKKLAETIRELTAEKLELKVAKVKTVRPVGMGDRVCVDTCSLMNIGEGMLIGSQSNGLFLVHSESVENPYVETRPFRVNAGPVHAYIKVPEEKTRYLSELKAGDEVLIVDSKGNTRIAVVGRVKIERRPLMLIEAEVNGEIFSTLVQNAETIMLVNENGNPVSVTDIKIGDRVLVYLEGFGRHFGISIEETLVER